MRGRRRRGGRQKHILALVSNTENRSGLLKVTAVFVDGIMLVERSSPSARTRSPSGAGALPGGRRQGYSSSSTIGAAPVDVVVDHSTCFNVDGRFWRWVHVRPAILKIR
jgi:hypothetical protein